MRWKTTTNDNFLMQVLFVSFGIETTAPHGPLLFYTSIFYLFICQHFFSPHKACFQLPRPPNPPLPQQEQCSRGFWPRRVVFSCEAYAGSSPLFRVVARRGAATAFESRRVPPLWGFSSLWRACRCDAELRARWWTPRRRRLCTGGFPVCPGSSPPAEPRGSQRNRSVTAIRPCSGFKSIHVITTFN